MTSKSKPSAHLRIYLRISPSGNSWKTGYSDIIPLKNHLVTEMSSQGVCNNIHPTAQLGSTPIGSEDPARALLGHTGKSVYTNSTSLKLPMAHQVNCWKHKQQYRRVKRSLVHHDPSVHSWVQEQGLGLEPRLAWDSPTFKGKALGCSLYIEQVLHRLSFTGKPFISNITGKLSKFHKDHSKNMQIFDTTTKNQWSSSISVAPTTHLCFKALNLAYQVPWEQEHFQVEPHAIRQEITACVSHRIYGMVYLPTWRVDFLW